MYYICTSKYYNALLGCSGLASIKVDSKNQTYDSRNDCNAIISTYSNTLISGCKNTIIPNTVTSIGSTAFKGHSNLTSMTIPNSVTSIGEQAFSGCTSLSSITIPNTVTTIGEYEFTECSNLAKVTIEGGSFSIGRYAFLFCNKLTDIYFTGLVGTDFSIYDKSPYSYGGPFDDFKNVTVHVPTQFLENYPNVFFSDGFSVFGFKDLKTLDGSEIPKCETPTISYDKGKLSFNCATTGVEFHWTIESSNGENGSGISSNVYPSLKVSVYAAKGGYVNSDIATTQIVCDTGAVVGDVNGDGVVNVGDHVKLTEIIMGQQ